MDNREERIDEIGMGGFKVIQGGGFSYGVDAVLLAAFASGETGAKPIRSRSPARIADLGTGNGVVPFILAHKLPLAQIIGIEKNRVSLDRAIRGREINNLNDRISFVLSDVAVTGPELCRKADAVVSNPPYSTKWIGKDDPALINDPRFSPAGVLAPKSKADLAFTMHMLSWLAVDGTAAIVEFPGVLYRGAAEAKIRQYLVENNYVDAVIQLPPDLFFGTTIGTCIIVLKKSKQDNNVLFVDASKQFVREGNKNKLSAENQEMILETLAKRVDIDHVAALVSAEAIRENGFNLSVSSYVEAEDTREEVDIVELNARIKEIVERQAVLRASIDEIVAGLEGGAR